MTIIAASLPFLRLLLKEAVAKRSASGTVNSMYLEDMTRNIGTANRRSSPLVDDTDSEKSIMGETKRGRLRIEQGQARIDFA